MLSDEKIDEVYIDDDDDYGVNDYGDEDNKEEFEEMKGEYIADFVFKDLLRLGAQDDDFIPLGADLEQVGLDPDLKFKLEVRELLQKDIFSFSEKDKSMIKKGVRFLPFIQYKNSFLYVIGYYCYRKVLLEQDKTFQIRNIEYIQTLLKNEKIYTYIDTIRYARYWQYILMPQIHRN